MARSVEEVRETELMMADGALELALGTACKQARRAAKLTQRELAERVGISVSYASMIEIGRRAPTLVLVLLWARACGITAGSLVRSIERHLVEDAR